MSMLSFAFPLSTHQVKNLDLYGTNPRLVEPPKQRSALLSRSFRIRNTDRKICISFAVARP
jgi:hypothetical protein